MVPVGAFLIRATLLVLAALVACSSAQSPPEADSGVRGVALIGPQCPVVQQGQECPDAPVHTTLEIVRAGTDDVVARVSSGVDGTFSVPLEPGDYVVRLAEGIDPPGGLPQSVETPFRVEPDSFANVTVSFDSGIR